jgi:hypothetical protein
VSGESSRPPLAVAQDDNPSRDDMGLDDRGMDEQGFNDDGRDFDDDIGRDFDDEPDADDLMASPTASASAMSSATSTSSATATATTTATSRVGELLSPELAKAFLSPQVLYSTRNTWTEMYGYGLRFYVDWAGKVFCYEEEGVCVGVGGITSHFPDQDITVTLLSNMEDGAWDPAWKIHEMVVGGQMT